MRKIKNLNYNISSGTDTSVYNVDSTTSYEN